MKAAITSYTNKTAFLVVVKQSDRNTFEVLPNGSIKSSAGLSFIAVKYPTIMKSWIKL